MQQEGNEALINAYINNMANQINVLTQENILLKTRLELAEKNANDLQEQLNKEEEEDKEKDDFEIDLDDTRLVGFIYLFVCIVILFVS